MSDDSNQLPPDGPFGDFQGQGLLSATNLHQGLEYLRERFHMQLDALEALLRDRLERHEQNLRERESQLEQRANDLEHARLQLQVETDRWEHDRQSMIEQIEHDRGLLAEAWERVERAHVKGASVSAKGQAQPASNGHTRDERTPVVSVATALPQPVLEEVLWQFQSVRRDVRRQTAHSCAG
jgi:hypothetical protein